MKKILTSVCICLCVSLPSFAIEDVAQNSNKYYLRDCIKIALQNSPVIKDYKYKLQICGTDVSIAKSNYFPTITAGTSYWQGFNTERQYDDGYTKRTVPAVAVYLDQLIYDFGKTGSLIDMQKFYKNAAEYIYIDSICNTINDVKLKYFAVLACKSAVEIEQSNLEINKLILNETKRLYDAKKKNEIDYKNAQVYYDSAQIDLEEAKNNYINALQDLYKSMYIQISEDFEIANIDTFDYYDAYFSGEFLECAGQWHKIKNRERQEGIIGELNEIPFDMNYALEEAFKNSPDIKALNFTLEGIKKSLSYTKKQFHPTLSARVGYEYNNRYKELELRTLQNNQLNVAVKLESSINGLKYSGQTKQEEYKVKIAENNIEKFKSDLFHDVKKCYTDVQTDQRQVKIAKDKTEKALETLKLTGQAYVDNVNQITYLDLQNARQNYNHSKLEYVAQLKDYNSSLARLERITHIHDKEYFDLAFEGHDSKLLPKDLVIKKN